MARRRRRAQWLIAVLLWGSLQVAAAGGRTPPLREHDEYPAPSADLLMFLADFDDSDGEVLDRAELAAAEQRKQAPADTTKDDDDD